MTTTNTRARYGWLSIALHWLGAVGVIAMFAIGLNAEWAAEAGDRARGNALMAIHIALGVSLFALLAARVIAHYAQPQPAAPQQAPAFNFLRALTHHGLLLAIIILMISGPLAIWALAEDIKVWDVLTLPSPFATPHHDAHEWAEVAHAVGRYMLWVLLPLHVLAVIKHVVIDRDRVLQRMLGASER